MPVGQKQSHPLSPTHTSTPTPVYYVNIYKQLMLFVHSLAFIIPADRCGFPVAHPTMAMNKSGDSAILVCCQNEKKQPAHQRNSKFIRMLQSNNEMSNILSSFCLNC